MDNLPDHAIRKSTRAAANGPKGERLADIAAIAMLRRHDLMRSFAELFLLVVGVLYATGFLAAFTFLERFGVREAGSEFLKLKYIYVGILYFLFPLTVMLPAFALWGLWREPKQNKKVRVPFSTILLFLNMAFVFYVFICFAPVTFIHTRPWVIASVSIPTILGALLLQSLEDGRLQTVLARKPTFIKIRLQILQKATAYRRWLQDAEAGRPRWRQNALTWLGKRSRWLLRIWNKIGRGRTALLVGIVWLVDNPSMHGLWNDLRLMFWGGSESAIIRIGSFKITAPVGGFNYYLFVFLYLLVGERVYKRMKQRRGLARTRYLLAGGGLCISLFIISVLAFAVRVYPFIPALKGGGDYRKTAATLILKEPREHELNLPESVVIIEETDSSVFIAIPTEPPVPKTENTTAEGEWRLWNDLPTVVEIPREAVAYMRYWPPGKKAATVTPHP